MVGSDGHAPADCCGDVGGADRTRWLEPVSSLQVTTAVLCGIGALINLLLSMRKVSHYRYITVTLPLHYRYINVTSRLRYTHTWRSEGGA